MISGYASNSGRKSKDQAFEPLLSVVKHYGLSLRETQSRERFSAECRAKQKMAIFTAP